MLDSADVFNAIAAPPRRAMLRLLADNDLPAKQLAEHFNMSFSAVSQHLSVLKDAGLVESRKDGKQRIYSLCPEPLQSVSEWIAYYEPFWLDRLSRLGKYLDENP
jgi:DNA-binding transcriptional ArsR family regulator